MVKLYVEGGGDSNAMRIACRKGFNDFLTKAGLGNKPRIVACGSRRSAYDRFCFAMRNEEPAFLLVDSESPVQAKLQNGNPDQWLPWQHLKARPGDGWEKPPNAEERQCHLMVECMENWFLCDAATLAKFFGQGFQSNKLPSLTQGVESVPNQSVYQGLDKATNACKRKASYRKGEHSFEILSRIDPALVLAASPWAARFVNNLKGEMDR